MTEHRLKSHAQAFQLMPGQPPSSPPWPNSRLEQALIGVNISYSAQQLLIQQSRFDGQLSAAKQPGKFRSSNGHWLIARGAESFRLPQLAKLQPPESPRVDKPNLPSALQA
jgi:hypothetical protein